MGSQTDLTSSSSPLYHACVCIIDESRDAHRDCLQVYCPMGRLCIRVCDFRPHTLLSLDLLGHKTPAERSRNDSESIVRVMHLVDEQIMSICQTRLPPSHFPDDGMLPGTQDTLRFRVRQASGTLTHTRRYGADNSPLMVRVLAHEVYTWKIQLGLTRSAPCDLEDLRR